MGGRRVPVEEKDDGNGGFGAGKIASKTQTQTGVVGGKSRRQQLEDEYYEREVEEAREKVELLGDNGRTIYKTRGDGMGGRKGGDEWRGY